MPPSISEEASMYVGMHADIEIQSAAKLPARHLRRDAGTGARKSAVASSGIPVEEYPPFSARIGFRAANSEIATENTPIAQSRCNRSKLIRARRIFTSPQAALSVLIDGRFTYEDVRDQEER